MSSLKSHRALLEAPEIERNSPQIRLDAESSPWFAIELCFFLQLQQSFLGEFGLPVVPEEVSKDVNTGMQRRILIVRSGGAGVASRRRDAPLAKLLDHLCRDLCCQIGVRRTRRRGRLVRRRCHYGRTESRVRDFVNSNQGLQRPPAVDDNPQIVPLAPQGSFYSDRRVGRMGIVRRSGGEDHLFQAGLELQRSPTLLQDGCFFERLGDVTALDPHMVIGVVVPPAEYVDAALVLTAAPILLGVRVVEFASE